MRKQHLRTELIAIVAAVEPPCPARFWLGINAKPVLALQQEKYT
jgi:hypothetical protein